MTVEIGNTDLNKGQTAGSLFTVGLSSEELQAKLCALRERVGHVPSYWEFVHELGEGASVPNFISLREQAGLMPPLTEIISSPDNTQYKDVLLSDLRSAAALGGINPVRAEIDTLVKDECLYGVFVYNKLIGSWTEILTQAGFALNIRGGRHGESYAMADGGDTRSQSTILEKVRELGLSQPTILVWSDLERYHAEDKLPAPEELVRRFGPISQIRQAANLTSLYPDPVARKTELAADLWDFMKSTDQRVTSHLIDKVSTTGRLRSYRSSYYIVFGDFSSTIEAARRYGVRIGDAKGFDRSKVFETVDDGLKYLNDELKRLPTARDLTRYYNAGVIRFTMEDIREMYGTLPNARVELGLAMENPNPKDTEAELLWDLAGVIESCEAAGEALTTERLNRSVQAGEIDNLKQYTACFQVLRSAVLSAMYLVHYQDSPPTEEIYAEATKRAIEWEEKTHDFVHRGTEESFLSATDLPTLRYFAALAGPNGKTSDISAAVQTGLLKIVSDWASKHDGHYPESRDRLRRVLGGNAFRCDLLSRHLDSTNQIRVGESLHQAVARISKQPPKKTKK